MSPVARFYTRSRKFTKFLGRLPDGTKIPFGPYTLTQGLVIVIAFGVMMLTRPLWTTTIFLVDLILVIVASVGAGIGAGRLPHTRRSPVSMVIGFFSAITSPATGHYRGAAIRLKPPRGQISRIAIEQPQESEPLPEPAHTPSKNPQPEPQPRPSTPPQHTPTPDPAPVLAGSGLERLMQKARAN